MIDYGPSGNIDYVVSYTSGCEAPSNSVSMPSTPLTVSFQLGESAVNIMEAAANQEPSYNFILSNVFGLFYTVHAINGVAVTSSCLWCPYFSPATGVTPYLLTADVNNFIIPLADGTLTMEYKSSCGSQAYDDLIRRKGRNVHVIIPPHYNPFMTSKKTCSVQSDKGHCMTD